MLVALRYPGVDARGVDGHLDDCFLDPLPDSDVAAKAGESPVHPRKPDMPGDEPDGGVVLVEFPNPGFG